MARDEDVIVRWFKHHRWVVIVAFLWLFRLYLGTLEAGGLDPETRLIDAPSPLAGIIGRIVAWITVALVLGCLAYEAKRYRRTHPRIPKLWRLD